MCHKNRNNTLQEEVTFQQDLVTQFSALKEKESRKRRRRKKRYFAPRINCQQSSSSHL
jgi:hypothetical protein